MKDNLVIGIAGVAGSGKDTFYKILRRFIKIKRYSLADILKEEVREDCMAKNGIDPLNCTRAEKEMIRDYLVQYGKKKREETEGRYFIEKLNEKILPLKENICVTDIRYQEYGPKDEAAWIKHELKGYMVYVQKYKWLKNAQGFKNDPPANEEEERNDPNLQKCYDYFVDWEHLYEPTQAQLHAALTYHAEKFVEWLEKELAFRGRRIDLK